MKALNETATNPRLLQRVADWRDDPAWHEFFAVYDPMIRRWCGVYHLNDDHAEELYQRIWVELASRIRTFQYDPRQTFRGWLRRLVQYRGLDLIREFKLEQPMSLDERLTDQIQRIGTPGDDETELEPSAQRASLLEVAELAQAAVRKRVTPDSWQIFWLIAIEDWAIRDAAEHLGKKYVATFRAHQRVSRMLGDEGRKLLSSLKPGE